MFYDEFVKLCSKKNVSRTKACIDCGVSRTAWHKWEGGAIPNGTTINKFAAYFGVSVAQLLSEENIKTPTDGERNGNSPTEPKLSEGEQMLINLFRQVPDDQKELVLQMIRAALGKM